MRSRFETSRILYLNRVVPTSDAFYAKLEQLLTVDADDFRQYVSQSAPSQPVLDLDSTLTATPSRKGKAKGAKPSHMQSTLLEQLVRSWNGSIAVCSFAPFIYCNEFLSIANLYTYNANTICTVFSSFIKLKEHSLFYSL